MPQSAPTESAPPATLDRGWQAWRPVSDGRRHSRVAAVRVG